MFGIDERDELQQQTDYLNNLKEDLRVVENSWRKKKLQRKKAVKHFVEIVDSALEIARTQAVDHLESVCADVRQFLLSDSSGAAKFQDSSWSLVAELIDILRDSLVDGEAVAEKLADWEERWKESTYGTEGELEMLMGESEDTLLSLEESRVKQEGQSRGEDKMVGRTEAERLLREAQQALSTGNGDNAKELALQAAQLIAKLEAEEAMRKEELLKESLEEAAKLETEAEETLKPLREELAEREQELDSASARLADAESSLEERVRACKEIKEQIDKAESELAALKERHANLLEQYQETLPARDAAERECSRLETELETLRPEVEGLRENIGVCEKQMEEARQKRAEIEAELEKLSQKPVA